MNGKDKRGILILIGIIAIILFMTAPTEYSIKYVTLCSVLFITSSIIMLSSNCKYSFLKFEFFFLIAFLFSNYIYSLVLYPVNPYFSLFSISFNESYITKGTALATVAGTWFNIGIFEINPITLPPKTRFNVIQRLKSPQKFTIVLFLLFLPYLFSIYQTHEYSTEFESSYVNVILKYVLLYSIFAFIFNNRKDKLRVFINRALTSLIILLSIIYVTLFLLIGSRTIPLNIVLFSLFLINILIYRISKKQIVLLITSGALLLTLVGIARGGSGVAGGEISSIWDVGADLIINNRSLYVLMEQVDGHGLTYGMTMMMYVLSALPFAQLLFLNITGLPLSTISTAVLVTDLHFGTGYNPDRFGLGTNLVGDVYIAFGIIGVIYLFWLFGFVLKKLYFQISKGKALSLLIYALLFMSSVYYTRTGYLTPVRDVVWVLGAYWLSNLKLKKHE